MYRVFLPTFIYLYFLPLLSSPFHPSNLWTNPLSFPPTTSLHLPRSPVFLPFYFPSLYLPFYLIPFILCLIPSFPFPSSPPTASLHLSPFSLTALCPVPSLPLPPPLSSPPPPRRDKEVKGVGWVSRQGPPRPVMVPRRGGMTRRWRVSVRCLDLVQGDFKVTTLHFTRVKFTWVSPGVTNWNLAIGEEGNVRWFQGNYTTSHGVKFTLVSPGLTNWNLTIGEEGIKVSWFDPKWFQGNCSTFHEGLVHLSLTWPH